MKQQAIVINFKETILCHREKSRVVFIGFFYRETFFYNI